MFTVENLQMIQIMKEEKKYLRQPPLPGKKTPLAAFPPNLFYACTSFKKKSLYDHHETHPTWEDSKYVS